MNSTVWEKWICWGGEFLQRIISDEIQKVGQIGEGLRIPLYETCIFILQTVGNLLPCFLCAAFLQSAWHRMLGTYHVSSLYELGHKTELDTIPDTKDLNFR